MRDFYRDPQRAIYDELVEIKEILMSTSPSGLAQLQQAVADLTAAVTAATAALASTGDSDATVATLAADVEAQAAALKAATPAA
jgi:hypothetical protein